jgi:hypothetical protein
VDLQYVENIFVGAAAAERTNSFAELPVALSQCSWWVQSTYTSGISDSHSPEDLFRFTYYVILGFSQSYRGRSRPLETRSFQGSLVPGLLWTLVLDNGRRLLELEYWAR